MRRFFYASMPKQICAHQPIKNAIIDTPAQTANISKKFRIYGRWRDRPSHQLNRNISATAIANITVISIARFVKTKKGNINAAHVTIYAPPVYRAATIARALPFARTAR